MRTIQIEAIVFRKNGNSFDFLLLKRIPEEGGFWQPPCGGLNDNEDILQAAYRELFEETSISKKDILNIIENVHYFEINKHYLTGKPMPLIKEYVLAFEVGMETVVNIKNNKPKEHEDFLWVSYDEALKMLKWENNKDAFKKLFSLLVKYYFLDKL